MNTSNQRTVFPLNQTQNESIMQDVERLSQQVSEWLDNGGREQLTEAMQRAEATSKAIAEALRPDPELLRQPMTI